MKALVAAALLVAQQAGAPQTPTPTFQTNVDLVALDVAVTKNGAPVVGLSTKDFVVLDNGVEQEIAGASRDDQVPLDVQLVLDTSGSLSDARLQHLVSAATAVVSQLHDDDRIGLITFSEIVRVRSQLTNDYPAVRRILASLAPSGQSAVRDAIELGLSLRSAANARPLLIVFTDGVDNASWLSDDELVESARQAGVVVHVVRVPLDRDPMPNLLERLSKATGGRIFRANRDGDFERLFAAALSEMRSRYLLTFAPPKPQPGGWHNLEVKIRSGKADIAARPGYFAP